MTTRARLARAAPCRSDGRERTRSAPLLPALLVMLVLLGCTTGHAFAQDTAPETAPAAVPAAAPDLSARDVALLREASHLQAELGEVVWPGWEPAQVPVLYLVGEQAWLLDHPSPPEEYTPVFSAALGRDAHIRPRAEDEGALKATYPIAGHSTVVIAAPEDDAEAHLWTLVFAHEMFHCRQGDGKRHIDPFTGEFAEHHELSYPFPYEDEAVRAAMRLEAELVQRLVAAPEEDAPDLVAARLLEQCATVDRAVLGDERHLLFKRWEEWKEGVAKYVERELSCVAAEQRRYEPLPEFAALFPGDGYASAWTEHHEGQLNPVRFVGAGVSGRVMFYYLGLGKAVALDRLMPDWKARYPESSLDELLIEAASR